MEIEEAKAILQILDVFNPEGAMRFMLGRHEEREYDFIIMNQHRVLQNDVALWVDEDIQYYILVLEAPEATGDGPLWLFTIEGEVIHHDIAKLLNNEVSENQSRCCDGKRALQKLEAVSNALFIRRRSDKKMIRILDVYEKVQEMLEG